MCADAIAPLPTVAAGYESYASTFNLQKYGLLYKYQAAIDHCPPGWRLPTFADWTELIGKYGEVLRNPNSNEPQGNWTRSQLAFALNQDGFGLIAGSCGSGQTAVNRFGDMLHLFWMYGGPTDVRGKIMSAMGHYEGDVAHFVFLADKANIMHESPSHFSFSVRYVHK